ncbi:sel1 repeat family protein [Luteibacter sp. SG786]|uniref:sel1 repeat family protein n=1 Tax=Luteibacter sp. SG786 TaxID=2587130 RepID=UPI0014242B3B|nr:sel1 repeat family protein [Luteibacter sp. SG786]NII53788.1 TPR repeat protein [Luteibacter sp. SG786]
MKESKTLLMSVLWFAVQTAFAQTAPEQPVNLNRDLVLTQQQLQTLAVEAMRGSSEAASKISVFYGFVLVNPMEERRWALIAAENGDPVAQYNVYEDFMNNDTALDRERALFWLRKSANAGYNEAQEKLKRVGEEGKRASDPHALKSDPQGH